MRPDEIHQLLQGRADKAQPDFDHCLKLNKNLEQSFDPLIVEATRQLTIKP
jgi:hypothetical protein